MITASDLTRGGHGFRRIRRRAARQPLSKGKTYRKVISYWLGMRPKAHYHCGKSEGHYPYIKARPVAGRKYRPSHLAIDPAARGGFDRSRRRRGVMGLSGYVEALGCAWGL